MSDLTPKAASSLPRPEPLGLEPSFGFGDRIGLATPGHVEAMRRAGAGIEPIFPQQSIREMARTGRTPGQVMDDALSGMRAGRLDRPDGRRRRPPEDDARTSTSTAAVGFTFFTIDPSDHVDAPRRRLRRADACATKFAAVGGEVDWLDALPRPVGSSSRPGRDVDLDEPACLRAAVKYGRAINHALATGRATSTRRRGARAATTRSS